MPSRGDRDRRKQFAKFGIDVTMYPTLCRTESHMVMS